MAMAPMMTAMMMMAMMMMAMMMLRAVMTDTTSPPYNGLAATYWYRSAAIVTIESDLRSSPIIFLTQ